MEVGSRELTIGRYDNYDVDKAEKETLVTEPDGGGKQTTERRGRSLQ